MAYKFILLFLSCLLLSKNINAEVVDTEVVDTAVFDSAKLSYAQADYAKVIMLLKPLAQKGNSEAQVYLGWAYNDKGDYFQSEYWFKQAAISSNPTAQIELAQGLDVHGFGGGLLDLLRKQESEYWLKFASQKGCESAINQLMVHFQSTPQYQNLTEAYTWFLLSSPVFRKLTETLGTIPVPEIEGQKLIAQQNAQKFKEQFPKQNCYVIVSPKFQQDP